jgi:ankyrin repeat protein
MKISLDSLSKLAAISTPILLAIAGWYFSALASDKDITLKRFSESSTLLAAISGQNTDKQRDALFSLVDIERPDLLRRSVAYLNANLEFKHRQLSEGIERDYWSTPKPNPAEEQLRAEDFRYRQEKEQLFYPLLLGAIAAKDSESVRIIVDGAPALLGTQQMVEIKDKVSVLQTPLDYAIDTRSRDLVEFFLTKGVQPGFWSVNKAIDSGDAQILRAVAQRTSRDWAVASPIWEHVAAKGSQSDVELLTMLGFARNIGTAIGTQPILTEAALSYRADTVWALIQAGFPVSEIDDEQSHELMSIISRKYNHDRIEIFNLPPDTEAFERTIATVCAAYLQQRISESDIRLRQRFTKVEKAEIDADRDQVFEAIFDAKAWRAFDCVRRFYAFDKLDADHYEDLARSAAIKDGVLERLITQYGFPTDIKDYDGRNLALQVASFGNVHALKLLVQRGLDLKQLDNNGRGIYSAILDSEFNKVDDTVIRSLELRRLAELLQLAVLKVGINFQDKRGFTAIMIAARNRSADQMKEILRYKPNLNLSTADHDTVLSLTARDPQRYLELYSIGARAPGMIDSCETFRELLTRVMELQWMYRPSDKDGKTWGNDRWNPEDAVRASAPASCSTE